VIWNGFMLVKCSWKWVLVVNWFTLFCYIDTLTRYELTRTLRKRLYLSCDFKWLLLFSIFFILALSLLLSYYWTFFLEFANFLDLTLEGRLIFAAWSRWRCRDSVTSGITLRIGIGIHSHFILRQSWIYLRRPFGLITGRVSA
jgi:hypothetical protein